MFSKTLYLFALLTITFLSFASADGFDDCKAECDDADPCEMAVYGTVGGCSWTNCQGAVDAFLEAKEGKIYWKEGSKSKTEEKCRKQLGLAPTSSVNNSTMPATTATDATGGAITSAAASVTSAGASAAATTSSQALGNALVWEQGGVSGLLAAFLMMFL